MIRRVFAFIRYVFIFLREMSIANITVVKMVLSPTLKIRPGFISIPMTARGDFEVTSYANSITLTPGTVSVHIPDDRHAIVVHAIDVGDDPETLRQSCATVLEANILKWTRSEADQPGERRVAAVATGKEIAPSSERNPANPDKAEGPSGGSSSSNSDGVSDSDSASDTDPSAGDLK